MPEPGSQQPRDGAAFPTTLWSQIRVGAGAGGTPAREALEGLARRYDRPIRTFLQAVVRRPAVEIEDLAQGFFAAMLESELLRRADPSRGRFRAFIKVALRHYVSDVMRAQATERRGGGAMHQPLPGEGGEPGLADSSTRTPEQLLDERWRATLLERALERTESEFCESGRAAVFAVFRDYYLAAGEAVDYRALAARHGITRTDVSNRLMRAKRLYRSHLRALVLETVHTPEELDEELRWLFAGEPT